MDGIALIEQSRATRRAKGFNVTWLRDDGTPDEWSFPSAERAEAFRAKCIRHGKTVVSA